jgi:hypothetical protein
MVHMDGEVPMNVMERLSSQYATICVITGEDWDRASSRDYDEGLSIVSKNEWDSISKNGLTYEMYLSLQSKDYVIPMPGLLQGPQDMDQAVSSLLIPPGIPVGFLSTKKRRDVLPFVKELKTRFEKYVPFVMNKDPEKVSITPWVLDMSEREILYLDPSSVQVPETAPSSLLASITTYNMMTKVQGICWRRNPSRLPTLIDALKRGFEIESASIADLTNGVVFAFTSTVKRLVKQFDHVITVSDPFYLRDDKVNIYMGDLTYDVLSSIFDRFDNVYEQLIPKPSPSAANRRRKYLRELDNVLGCHVNAYRPEPVRIDVKQGVVPVNKEAIPLAVTCVSVVVSLTLDSRVMNQSPEMFLPAFESVSALDHDIEMSTLDSPQKMLWYFMAQGCYSDVEHESNSYDWYNSCRNSIRDGINIVVSYEVKSTGRFTLDRDRGVLLENRMSTLVKNRNFVLTVSGPPDHGKSRLARQLTSLGYTIYDEDDYRTPEFIEDVKSNPNSAYSKFIRGSLRDKFHELEEEPGPTVFVSHSSSAVISLARTRLSITLDRVFDAILVSDNPVDNTMKSVFAGVGSGTAGHISGNIGHAFLLAKILLPLVSK